MDIFDFSQVAVWFSGELQSPYAVTICSTEQMNINAKLLEQLPPYFEIGVSADGHTLCFREKENGYKRLKSGSVKDARPIRYILDQGVHLPARYTVTEQSGVWIGTLDKQKQPALNITKPPRRPKAKKLEGVLQELENA